MQKIPNSEGKPANGTPFYILVYAFVQSIVDCFMMQIFCIKSQIKIPIGKQNILHLLLN